MSAARHPVLSRLPGRSVWARVALLMVALALGAAWLAEAHASGGGKARPTTRTVRIALIADIPQWPDAEATTARLLDLFAERKLSFVIHAGGIKGDTESCADAVLSARYRLLNQSPLPLIYVPGEPDWAECDQPVNGSFDDVERLNRLRELFFADDDSLGQRRLALMRQSDQATFRAYRENARWVAGDALLVAINLPGNNNNYRKEGGRNGEFEDRREANRQWLSRAFSLAKQQELSAIVLVAHGDPQFGNGWEKRGKPTLLDGFMRRGTRDGYLEFKRQLRDLASRYRGQVLLVHTSLNGFGIDTPLRDANGKSVRNVTRVALPVGTGSQWTELVITPDSPSPFTVTLKDGPAVP
jgi:hypothetical protein